MIRNSISVCKSIRLHLINPVSQFQSTLDLFFRFLPCPLFLFVAFFLLYRRHLRCIQEHIIHVHKAVRMCLWNHNFQNMILQSRFNRHHTRIEQCFHLRIKFIYGSQLFKLRIRNSILRRLNVAIPFIAVVIPHIHQGILMFFGYLYVLFPFQVFNQPVYIHRLHPSSPPGIFPKL